MLVVVACCRGLWPVRTLHAHSSSGGRDASLCHLDIVNSNPVLMARLALRTHPTGPVTD